MTARVQASRDQQRFQHHRQGRPGAGEQNDPSDDGRQAHNDPAKALNG